MDLPNLTKSLRALNLLDKADACKIRDTELPIISLDQVSWHDTVDDCWIVIWDYVYDCTNFLAKHPGDLDVLLEYAGRDATLAFVGVGHSKEANVILEELLIGELPVTERIFRTPDGLKIDGHVWNDDDQRYITKSVAYCNNG